MDQDVLSTPSVSCMSCAGKIEDALEGLEGIDAADVDIELKQVSVTYASDVIDRARIVEVLEETGYEATPLIADDQ